MLYKINKKNEELELEIQQKINKCLDNFTSFCFDAGAGAGKTYALKKAIEYILKTQQEKLKKRNQKILCITYTNAAKNEILDRLGRNSSVEVSTIHEFLWSFISIQQELLMIEHKEKIKEELNKLEEEIDNNSLSSSVNLEVFQKIISNEEFLNLFYNTPTSPADKFRTEIIQYNKSFESYLNNVKKFSDLVKLVSKRYKLIETLEEILENKPPKIRYNPLQNRDKLESYVISHDTLLQYCRNIIMKKDLLKRLLSDRYPYVLVDEYQDTDEKVVSLINSVREYSDLKRNFVVGFFGDAVQNIYETGVGSLPNKDKYINIEKIYNRRSANQIIELIEKIRNDNFGQNSIFSNFNDGSYHFFVAKNEFNLNEFLQKNNLTNNTACLLMKNDEISMARGFDALLSALRKFPRFSRNNYDNVSNEFLQKNTQHIGWFFREVLTFVEFILKSRNPNTTVSEIVQFLGDKKSSLTFGELKEIIGRLKSINLTSITIEECIFEISNINTPIFGSEILRRIFLLDKAAIDTLANIKNRAYDYFFFYQNSEEDLDRDMTFIDEFFNLDFSQFVKWYEYIYDDKQSEDINYYTLHGSKGLEFDNVVVVLQDKFAGKSNFCKYFFENYNHPTEDDIDYKKVRNLLYVACSRAKKNLYVIYKSHCVEDVRGNINNIFGEFQELD